MAIHAMQFQDENEKQKFIHDEKYFGSLNSYSLENRWKRRQEKS